MTNNRTHSEERSGKRRRRPALTDRSNFKETTVKLRRTDPLIRVPVPGDRKRSPAA